MKKVFFLFSILFLGLNLYAIPDRFNNLLTEVQYNQFWSYLELYLESNNLTYIPSYDNGTLEIDGANSINTISPFFKNEIIGLDNLIQNIIYLEMDLWYQYIEDYFERIADSKRTIYENTDNFMNYRVAKEFLKIKIYPESYISTISNVIYEESLIGCNSVLVFDMGDYIINVRSEIFESWNVGIEEVIDLALQQTLDSIEIEQRDYYTESGVVISAIYSSSLFLATYLYNFNIDYEFEGQFGTLFSIPNREVMLIYKINDYNNLRNAGNEFSQITKSLYETGTGSLSPFMYWFFEGEILPAEKIIGHSNSVEMDIQ